MWWCREFSDIVVKEKFTLEHWHKERTIESCRLFVFVNHSCTVEFVLCRQRLHCCCRKCPVSVLCLRYKRNNWSMRSTLYWPNSARSDNRTLITSNYKSTAIIIIIINKDWTLCRRSDLMPLDLSTGNHNNNNRISTSNRCNDIVTMMLWDTVKCHSSLKRCIHHLLLAFCCGHLSEQYDSEFLTCSNINPALPQFCVWISK